MDHQSKPLLQRTSLFPDESLPSLLKRLAILNSYQPASILYSLCDLKAGSATMPTETHVYAQLEVLTRIDAYDLYRATAHRFVPILRPPGSREEILVLPSNIPWLRLSSTLARGQLRAESRAQFCPHCLRDSAYHRLHWMSLAVTACLKHNCLLVHKCTSCGKDVDIGSIVSITCHHCESHLTTMATVSIEHDTVGLFAQQIIQQWFAEGKMTAYFLPDSLPQKNANCLYSVLNGLRRCLADVKEWDYWHQIPNSPLTNPHPCARLRDLTPEKCHILFTTIFRAINEWPTGFHKFMKAYSLRKEAKNGSGIHSDLNNLYSQWLAKRWQHPDFQFIHAAFHDYLVANYGLSSGIKRSKLLEDYPELLDRFDRVDMVDAASLLDVAPGTVKTLIRDGVLADVTPPSASPRQRGHFVARQEVTDLRREWERAVPLQNVAKWLGISNDLARQLVDVGLLEGIRGPFNDGHQRWRISKRSVSDCLERLNYNTRPCRGVTTTKFKNLTQAAQMLATVGLNAALILERVASGKLPAYRTGLVLRSLQSIYFRPPDIEQCSRQVPAENGWVARDYIASRMGVKVDIISRWIESGLIKLDFVHGQAQYFDKDSIDTFVQEHVFTEEAAEILELNELTVQKWARCGRLKPVSGWHVDGCHRYLFRRDRVERLRPRNRLTAPQLANLLRISRSQLGEWIRQEKVKPYSGPGTDKSKHYLFLLDEHAPEDGLSFEPSGQEESELSQVDEGELAQVGRRLQT